MATARAGGLAAFDSVLALAAIGARPARCVRARPGGHGVGAWGVDTGFSRTAFSCESAEAYLGFAAAE